MVRVIVLRVTLELPILSPILVSNFHSAPPPPHQNREIVIIVVKGGGELAQLVRAWGM